MRKFANLPPQMALECVNTSASILDKGAVVVLNTSGTSSALQVAVTTTTTFNNSRAIGIIESRVAATSGQGRMITQGITPVTCAGSVAVGDLLYTSTTAGQATNSTSTTNPRIPFGVVLVANSGAGTNCIAYVNFLSSFDISTYQHPDFDSGWFAVGSSTTYTYAHLLGATPRRVELWHATSTTPAGGNELVRVTQIGQPATAAVTGDCVGADSTNVYATSTAATGAATIYSTRRASNAGAWRIQAWR
jgi:hypothetical protein